MKLFQTKGDPDKVTYLQNALKEIFLKMIFEDLFGFPPNWRTRVLVFYFPGLKGGGTFTFVFGPILV